MEGNCDSPVPIATQVPSVPGTGGSTSGGICGDWDGDGRISTAEDTDGADRIFGTINAALGPGAGAAAGTGANFNGTLLIVASGRFAERIYIGHNPGGPEPLGTANPGNVTIEAAPGVEADIDAVLQGDPAGASNTRQSGFGIAVSYIGADAPFRVVTLRNLTVRNYDIGIWVNNGSRVHIDNCRVENNFNYGIRVDDTARAVITNTSVNATGFRIGTFSGPLTVASGIVVSGNAQARIMNSTATQSANGGIVNNTGNAANVVLFKVGTFFNTGGDLLGPITIAPNTNHAQ
ncbi:MAG TPA: right-handed parallel beta-helix repeat-containing protein [Pyrinomonadaceae bacterium]|nr:right-handed parallel beta-helix repeat-containing protein [Pyrinomonadaceae bacterium]